MNLGPGGALSVGLVSGREGGREGGRGWKTCFLGGVDGRSERRVLE